MTVSRRKGGQQSLILVGSDGDDSTMAWCKRSFRLGILHEMKPSQVAAFGELVVVITVAVIHQAPPTIYQGEDTCSLNIALGGLAESVKKFPCGRLIYVFKDILPNAFMGSVCLSLEKKMQKSTLVSHDIRVNGRQVFTEDNLLDLINKTATKFIGELETIEKDISKTKVLG